jgi:hypothetical protein
MCTGRRRRRTHRRGPACAVALAALAAACAGRPRQPAATAASLRRLAVAVRHDAYGRPLSLGPLLGRRVVLYFARTDCAHCAAGLAAARALAAAGDAPPLVVISREAAGRLRAFFGPPARGNLVVVSDEGGAIMRGALPTRYVPRIVAVERFEVRLDATGERGPGLSEVVAELAGGKR